MHAFVTFLLLSLFSSTRNFGRTAEEALHLSEESLAKRINDFGCHLLSSVSERAATPEDNILVSPINVYATLALLHLGADDVTLIQLSAVLKVSDIKNSTELHHHLHALLSKLSTKSQDSGKQHETVITNGIFVNNDFPIKDSYLQVAKKYFDALAENVDFSHHAQESTNIINEWISKSTKSRIAKFYEKSLSPSTRAVLASALYFNAQWKDWFPVENTKTEKFNTGSAEIEVPMMSSERELYYVRDDTLHYDSVTLPYSGREYEMTVYLQHTHHGDQGSLTHLFHQLTQQHFIAKTAQRSLVHLKLPKMKFAFKKSLVHALKLEAIFENVHMAEMTPLRNLTISDMMHATELEVDEKGTIATTANAVQMMLTSGRISPSGEPIMFHVDRPFLMTITHKPTQTILFTGIIRKPIE